jgi:hypothetical protein
VAQEKVVAFRSVMKGPRRRQRTPPGGRPPQFTFYRGHVDVNQYYFYILDRDFGLCFIKISSYAPFGIRVWINGHEWAKRQLTARGIAFEELDNGFLSCVDAKALQEICDSFSAEHVDTFFRKWLSHLPHPFTREDRAAGYRYQLSILQCEVSLTQVFERPLYGREFFEEVIRDNLDLGRPDRVQLLFERRVTRRTPVGFGPASSPLEFSRVSVSTTSAQVSSSTSKAVVRFAPRPRSIIRMTSAFGGQSATLSRLRTLGRHINHRLLSLGRVAQHCAVSASTVEPIVLPSGTEHERAPAHHWGDPRTMALFAALCAFAATPTASRTGNCVDASPRSSVPDRAATQRHA